jgi:lipoic acid synthetase
LPDWLRKPEKHFGALHDLKSDLRSLGLHTVCESARCPNIHECFHRGAATFMILGDRCTRSCGFCAVRSLRSPDPPDPEEPRMVAHMASRLGLRHVVVTSVTRDDLPDGGASHFACTVLALREALPEARVEVLTPDFGGDPRALSRVLDSHPHIFNHNMETVARLYPRVRPQAEYRRSLDVLRFARSHAPGSAIKSGLMVGLGEEAREVERLLDDLRDAGAGIVTIGQYLQPTRENMPVVSFVPPRQFDAWRDYGISIGFQTVLSGPFVRSSYMAEMVAAAAELAERPLADARGSETARFRAATVRERSHVAEAEC